MTRSCWPISNVHLPKWPKKILTLVLPTLDTSLGCWYTWTEKWKITQKVREPDSPYLRVQVSGNACWWVLHSFSRGYLKQPQEQENLLNLTDPNWVWNRALSKNTWDLLWLRFVGGTRPLKHQVDSFLIYIPNPLWVLEIYNWSQRIAWVHLNLPPLSHIS